MQFVGVAVGLEPDREKRYEGARVARIFERRLCVLPFMWVFQFDCARLAEPILQIALLPVELLRAAERYDLALARHLAVEDDILVRVAKRSSPARSFGG